MGRSGRLINKTILLGLISLVLLLILVIPAVFAGGTCSWPCYDWEGNYIDTASKSSSWHSSCCGNTGCHLSCNSDNSAVLVDIKACIENRAGTCKCTDPIIRTYQECNDNQVCYNNECVDCSIASATKEWVKLCDSTSNCPELCDDYGCTITFDNVNLNGSKIAFFRLADYGVHISYLKIYSSSGEVTEIFGDSKKYVPQEEYSPSGLSIDLGAIYDIEKITVKPDDDGHMAWLEPKVYAYYDFAPCQKRIDGQCQNYAGQWKDTNDCCYNGIKNTDGLIGLEAGAGDKEFICSQGQWYDCGWEEDEDWSEEKTTVEMVGDYMCIESGIDGDYWVDASIATDASQEACQKVVNNDKDDETPKVWLGDETANSCCGDDAVWKVVGGEETDELNLLATQDDYGYISSDGKHLCTYDGTDWKWEAASDNSFKIITIDPPIAEEGGEEIGIKGESLLNKITNFIRGIFG